MHILSRAFAEAHPEPFIALLPGVVRIVADKSFGIHWRPHVLGSALVCLASLCGGLGPRMLPYLPQFMTRLISVVDAAVAYSPSGKAASKHFQEVAVLAHSSMASLSAVVAHLPQFVSSHLAPLIGILTHHSFLDQSDLSESRHTHPVRAIRKSLCSLLAQRVNFRLLLPAISATFAVIDASAGKASSSRITLVQLRARTRLLVSFLGECWGENCRADAKQWVQMQQDGVNGASKAKAARRAFIQQYHGRVASLLVCGMELIASCFVTASQFPYLGSLRLVDIEIDSAVSNNFALAKKSTTNHLRLQAEREVLSSLAAEQSLCAAINSFVIKLTEGQLKPVFLSMCDWTRNRSRAGQGNGPSGVTSAVLALSGVSDSAQIAARIERAASIAEQTWDNEDGQTDASITCRQLRRSVVFWGVTGALCRKFRSIFVPYYEFVWRNAVDILHQSADTSAKSNGSGGLAIVAAKKRTKTSNGSSSGAEWSPRRCQLQRMQRERVLGALSECFIHSLGDSAASSIIDKDHFDAIMPEIVRQLDPEDKSRLFKEPTSVRSEFARRSGSKRGKSKRAEDDTDSEAEGVESSGFETRAAIMQGTPAALSQHLAGTEPFLAYVLGSVVPCLVHLARAAADDTLWKPLHFKVCMKSRSDDWRVRFAALKVIRFLLTCSQLFCSLRDVHRGVVVVVARYCNGVLKPSARNSSCCFPRRSLSWQSCSKTKARMWKHCVVNSSSK